VDFFWRSGWLLMGGCDDEDESGRDDVIQVTAASGLELPGWRAVLTALSATSPTRLQSVEPRALVGDE
jgi:hypothetical protein